MIMAVTMPKEKWTDERLDALNKKVDDGFADTKAEMRQGFARIEKEISGPRGDLNNQGDSLRGEMNVLRAEMNARFNSVDARFDAMNRNLIGFAVAIVAAVIGSNAFF